MEEISWDDVRKSDFLVIRQDVPVKGPRKKYHVEWAGQVTEHSPKWTKIKHAGLEMSVPAKYGEEEILRLSKREFNAYVKENYG